MVETAGLTGPVPDEGSTGQARIPADRVGSIEADPEFRRLVRERGTLGATVGGAMIAVYFGYILLLAFAPALLRTRISPNVTLGFPLGLGVMVITFILAAFYVGRSNARLDPLTAAIVARSVR